MNEPNEPADLKHTPIATVATWIQGVAVQLDKALQLRDPPFRFPPDLDVNATTERLMATIKQCEGKDDPARSALHAAAQSALTLIAFGMVLERADSERTPTS